MDETYADQRSGGGKPQPVNYGAWQGYPREQIPWYPTISAELCNGCGVCLRLCKNGVLALTLDDMVKVIEPLKCIVGCSSWATICTPKAITFPPRTMLDACRPRG